MNAALRYLKGVSEIIAKIEETQLENIMKAARLLADQTKKGGIIYGFGSGHSHLIPEDAFWRAATPANYCALYEPSISGSHEITKSYTIENTYDIGKQIIDYHRINENDVLIVFSNSGNNIAPVDAAIRAKEKGIPVIAITAVEYSDYLTTKHRDNVKLKDVVDIVLDNSSLIGDAVVEIKGFPMKVGSSSTIPMVLLQNMLLTQMVELLVKDGYTPDVYYNGHIAFMDEDAAKHNDDLVDKYFYKIRNL